MKKETQPSFQLNGSRPVHGGNIYALLRDKKQSLGRIVDFSANINPCGPPPWLRSLVNRELELITHYPDPDVTEFVDAVSRAYEIEKDYIVAANGTTELLHLLPRVISRRRVVVPVPCYVDYLAVFQNNGFSVAPFYLQEQDGFSIDCRQLSAQLKGDDAVIFGNPTNPVGTCISRELVLELARRHPETLFIIDEAFLEFQQDHRSTGGVLDNLITLNSLTKFYAIPGLRLGFGILPPHYRQRLSALLPQWSVNTLAQKIGSKALLDHQYAEISRATCAELSREMHRLLEAIPQLKVFPSRANYILLKLVDKSSAKILADKLLQENILVRCCDNYLGLDHSFFRVAVRTAQENELLVHHLECFLGQKRRPSPASKKKNRSLMFQGTSSNAGKSILTAAFCRIFLQDGLRVAPFKSQNMSLNSFVTRDGMEMGRAQVVQALAAKLDPDWRMNPVLLKPNSDTGSQVIVNGRPVGNMNVKQYHSYKETAWKSVTKSYDELAADYDCIVLEGAGSPGEINLKKHDIVNMNMAAYAHSPVLLVGDIDRGGVYASFAGIMDVLEEWERKLVAGFVVNKFRGDQSLLDEAHDFIFNHTGRDVLGVVPYINDLSIPQEDSVSMKDGFYKGRSTDDSHVEISVIDLPHIANFTDIDPLYYEPDVTIRIVKKSEEIGTPDAVIIPGSKNVAGDLRYLKERGFVEVIRDMVRRQCVVVGICGGYQMLGKKMADPHRIESADKEMNGIGLIDIETVLAHEKTLERKEGVHLPSGLKISGYEIHHGLSNSNHPAVLSFEDGTVCGSDAYDGRVWGAYLHGIFDEDLFRRWFIDDLRRRKGLEKVNRVLAPFDLDANLDALATVVRSCFDMEKIYQIMKN
ncbi:MAG: cobyric acid synthase [Desulfocapsaceae bacterium]|jgi:cobyric acid synthase CobQ/L-threonine-O-3-phosphate decarboxylase|nr:cobyric acid synthase [Desulfocapsaceae bacterium]